MRTTTLAMTAAIAIGSAANAQTIATYDPVGPAITENQPWTRMLPWPGGPTNIYPAVAMPPLMGFPLPGDSSWDGINGLHWLCNGTDLASQPTPLFAPLIAPTPPFPIAPGVLGAVGGVVTGIAYDPMLNVMWLGGAGGVFVGVTPIPGTPVVMPPFALMFATGPIAGLDWDGVTGSLYAVDAASVVYQFLPGGGPVAPPVVPALPLPAPVGDVCVDKSGQVNAAGLQPIYVTAGGLVDDITMPLPMPFPVGPPQAGMAYVGAPATNPPGFRAGAMCPTFPTPGPFLMTTSAMSAGNLAWSIQLTGVPPGQLVLFAFDLVFDPTWPMINMLGSPLGILLGSPTIATRIGFANPAGVATFPMPLAVPPGFGAIYNQNFVLCSADPAGFVVTPMQSIWASGL